MTTATKEPREVKLKAGFGNPQPIGKTFKVHEVDGIIKVLNRIEYSNPKVSMKVDYWLSKNKKTFISEMTKYVIGQNEIVKKYAVVYTNEQFKDKDNDKKLVEFLVLQGKDENDTILRDGSNHFKLSEKEGKPILDYIQNPMWVLEIPGKDGAEAIKQNIPYSVKYKTPEDEAACEVAINEFADNYDFIIDPYLLKEDYLEGVNVIWADGKMENVSSFKSYLYDNLIG